MGFKFDELVWAKMKGYAPWPGKIIFGHSSQPPSKKKKYYYVYFFASHNHAWIPLENMFKYVAHRREFSRRLVKNRLFVEGVKYIAGQYKGLLELKRDKHSGYPRSDSEDEDSDDDERIVKRRRAIRNRKLKTSSDKVIIDGVYVSSADAKLLKSARVKLTRMKSTDVYNVSEVSTSPALNSVAVSISSGNPVKMNSEMPETCHKNDTQSSLPISYEVNTSSGSLIISSNSKFKLSPSISIHPVNMHTTTSSPQGDTASTSGLCPSQQGCSFANSSSTSAIKIIEVPFVQPFNSLLGSVSVVEPRCEKKIGFIGLGNLGQSIVKTFLAAGHIVNVWNRSPEKYTEVLNAGAYKKSTPAEVVTSSDIIFCCVSDADASKKILFCREGVAEGFKKVSGSNRIYVDITTIDPESVKEIQEVIHSSGGLYFEVAVIGSVTDAINGSLKFIGVGNLNIFESIKPCLQSISNNVHYFGSKFGSAAEKTLPYCAIQGILYAALGECFSFFSRLGYNLREFKSIIQGSDLDCAAVMNKLRAVIEEDYTPEISVRAMQNQLSQALALGNIMNQPLPLTAASHESFKRAKRHHGEEDAISVYRES